LRLLSRRPTELPEDFLGAIEGLVAFKKELRSSFEDRFCDGIN
jgi:hypothetical protein